ncbi:dTDP-4-amino-4,6-dideoxygalactose transaminase [Sinobacterium caligoides]|uniref:dTDP-4-amino-4,6-dideoxygalactose transaminase n=1 Tax=Sinobacterium caligoides TaxID=933926 RepID=A0A3N2DJZ2_9GAMM|nr:DegT/DnrJ/EryC1/StrS family aminotransferase [Sinobacterium caligoides]ROS00120.1 dTDP-4-amino-4,6-dideoxygalactose transaminase [Sinobacterium caligoides]
MIKFVDLKAQYQQLKPEIDQAIERVLADCAFADGPYVADFERAFAKAQQAPHCEAVSSGTAALHLAVVALEIGQNDEVIVPANTFFATPEAVSLAGATPVFVDCESSFYQIDCDKIEAAITARTKAIIVVHLYGQPMAMEKVIAVAKKHRLLIIEDCAQAHLASYHGEAVGSKGGVGCFSFYPGKNLGAYGEGGAVVTSDADIAERVKALKNHGSTRKYHHDYIGMNYRMSGFQGAILTIKLQYLQAWTRRRSALAAQYREQLAAIKQIILPAELAGARHVYHLFVIRSTRRDALQSYLQQRGIQTGIHYPVPCHLQGAYKSLGYNVGSMPCAEQLAQEILSLPLYPELKDEELNTVCRAIKEFYL